MRRGGSRRRRGGGRTANSGRCVKRHRGPQWRLKCQRDVLKIFGSAHASRCPRRPMVHNGAAVVSKPLSLEETVRIVRVTLNSGETTCLRAHHGSTNQW